MDSAHARWLHPQRNILHASARRWVGGLSALAGRLGEALAMGARADGDPGRRPNPSAGLSFREPHPCRGARCAVGAVGDGGGRKMRRFVRRHRRIVGRSRSARLHRHAAARGRFGTIGRAVLAGPARRHREPQRCADAVAGRQPSLARQSARPARAGAECLGCRAVPGARLCPWSLEHRP